MALSLASNLRSLLKTSGATALTQSRLSNAVGHWRGIKRKPLIVGYHRIVKDFNSSKSLSISPMLTSTRTFERHLDWIGKRYQFVSLDELATRLENYVDTNKPIAAVTFDDGYRDVYRNAYPILERKGIPSAVFVVSDLVGTERLLVHDELYLICKSTFSKLPHPTEGRWHGLVPILGLSEYDSDRLTRRLNVVNNPFQATRAFLEVAPQYALKHFVEVMRGRFRYQESVLEQFRTLDWNMLTEMSSGSVTVGSHTRSHAMLDHESTESLLEQVDGSRRKLEMALGVPVRHFAYPDGKFNTEVIKAVADAGYHTAYTICSHRDDSHPLLTISRKMFWENSCANAFGHFSPAILNCQVNGIFDPSSACRVHHWA